MAGRPDDVYMTKTMDGWRAPEPDPVSPAPFMVQLNDSQERLGAMLDQLVGVSSKARERLLGPWPAEGSAPPPVDDGLGQANYALERQEVLIRRAIKALDNMIALDMCL